MIPFYFAQKIMICFVNNQQMVFVRNYVIANNNLAYKQNRLSRPIVNVFLIEQCSTTNLQVILRLGKIQNSNRIAKFQFGLVFSLKNLVKIEVDIDFVQFDFNQNNRIKITHTINSKYAYKRAPRSTYQNKREKSVSSVLNQMSYISPQPRITILPHISRKSITPNVLRCITCRYRILSVKKLSYQILSPNLRK